MCNAELGCTHGEGECPKDKLDAAQHSAAGLLIQRASILKRKLKAGITITDRDIPADEFQALLILEEEVDLLEKEQSCNGNDKQS